MKKEEGQLCRLCLRTDSNEIFEQIGETITETLEVLQLKLNFDISEERVICRDCMGSIRKCSDFKSTCQNAENLILPFYNSENMSKLDLREVYMQINLHIATDDSHGEQEICRLCLKLSRSYCCKPLIEIEDDLLEKCIPELNFNSTKEPVICDSCLNSLKFYFQFRQTCMDTEEQIIKYCKFNETNNDGQTNLNKVVQFMKNMLEYERDVKVEVTDLDGLSCETKESIVIKTEILVKKENVEFDTDNVETEITTDVEKNIKVEIDEESLKLQDGELEMVHEQYKLETKYGDFESFQDAPTSSEVIQYKCESCPFVTKYRSGIRRHLLIHRNPLEVTTYQCHSCSFETVLKSSLKRHMLIHQELPEVYTCKCCSFVTKQKSYLKTHMLIHQELSEVTVYKCEICSYITKRKTDITKHMVIHGSSEVYGCEQCSFKTKYKHYLKRHMILHRELSEVPVYKCDNCSFITRHKRSLKSHVLTHQNLLEAAAYTCESCSYVTKHKSNLIKHMLVHRELLEEYTCESCSYVAKRKSNLKRHIRRIHEDPSELTAYTCESCSYVTNHKCDLTKHKLIHRPYSNLLKEWEYMCESCSFVTRHKSSLKRHSLTHHQDPSEVTM